MKRTNQRFNGRIRIREYGTIDERVLYLEKINMILSKNLVVQNVINKELRGRCLTTAKHLINVRAQVKQLSERGQMAKIYGNESYEDMSNQVEVLAIKLDAMEELLEELV